MDLSTLMERIKSLDLSMVEGSIPRMELLWFPAGLLIGALLVRILLGRSSNRRLAEIEQRAQAKVEHAQADALEADRAHSDTKKLLIDAELQRKAMEARLAALDQERAQDRARLEAAQAEIEKAQSVARHFSMPMMAAGLAEKPAARFEADPGPAEKTSPGPTTTDPAAIESILSAAFLDKGPADDRVHSALSPMALAREALKREAEALRTGAEPDADEQRKAEADPHVALKRVEAKLAMLPAGSSARAALNGERERLRALVDSSPPLELRDIVPAPARASTPGLAAAVVLAEGGPPKPASPEARLKAVEAKLAMLPAGSSARAALAAERDRLLGSAPETKPVEPAAPAARRWNPPALAREVLLATPPEDREPDDFKRIKGIGPVLEGRLREFGIYHFEQLASMSPEEVAKVNSAMDFPGRIERDRWIDQAKAIIAARGA